MKMICPKCNTPIDMTSTFGPRFGATLGGLAGTIASRGLRGGIIGAAVGAMVGYLYRENAWSCSSCKADAAPDASSTPTTASDAGGDAS